MHTNLPIIATAGTFHSQDKFHDPQKYSHGSLTRLRTVTDYEIELFLHDGGICHMNGKSYPIHKGDILVAKPGDKRQSTLHFSALFIHFDTTDPAIQNLISIIGGYHNNIKHEKLESLFTDICTTAISFEPDSEILAAAKLISFLCTLKRSCLMNPSISSGYNSRSTISDAIEFIKQHYQEQITVDMIAKHCKLSSSYFYKYFLDVVHSTPYQYLLTIRLSAAKSMLATSSMAISEIASKCGFNSQAYFSDCFKRETGLTPSRFRSSFTYPHEQ